MARRYDYASSGSLATKWRNTSCASSWRGASPICMAAAAAVGKIAVISGTRGSELLPFVQNGRRQWSRHRSPLLTSKGECHVLHHRRQRDDIVPPIAGIGQQH